MWLLLTCADLRTEVRVANLPKLSVLLGHVQHTSFRKSVQTANFYAGLRLTFLTEPVRRYLLQVNHRLKRVSVAMTPTRKRAWGEHAQRRRT